MYIPCIETLTMSHGSLLFLEYVTYYIFYTFRLDLSCCYKIVYNLTIVQLTFHFSFSNIEEVISKFTQLTPQERAKRCTIIFDSQTLYFVLHSS